MGNTSTQTKIGPKPLTRKRQRLLEERELVMDRLSSIDAALSRLDLCKEAMELVDFDAKCHVRDFGWKGAV